LSSVNQYFATCAKGVEDLLQRELEWQGIENSKLQTGGVAFSGDIEAALRACLWSRVASRILLQLKSFEISNDDDLYREVISIDWSEHFEASNTLAIDCFSSHSTVNNSHFATLRVKDAVVDQFMQNVQLRPSIDRESPDIRINVYLSDKQCLIYLDLSGEALHKRGYRATSGSAPLRETLAAAMLYRAKWPSFYEQSLPFYDPMCGSGTLVIEAAMMAAEFAPGLLRLDAAIGFGFLRWKQLDRDSWSAVLQEAELKKQAGLESMPIICGSDINEKLVGIARSNLKAVGLASKIRIALQDATQGLQPCAGKHRDITPGLIVTNPPYGKRIGQVQQLRTLYYRFGQQLKQNFNGWTAVVITSESELAKSIGLRAFRKNTLYNGPLKSVLYQYRINAPQAGASDIKHPPESARHDKAAVTAERQPVADTLEQGERASKKAAEHAAMFINRLRKNYKHLKKWARKNGVDCYRVYDADIPQYSVAIDKYDDWIHVQEYQAPKTVDKTKAFQRVNDVLDVVADVLDTTQDKVVLKVRKRQEGSSQYQKQDQKGQKITVQENGLKFIVNLYDYLDTGLFLDHRNTRQLIRLMSGKRSFLNLFAYTGSVTVYAAAGGASTTTTVDMSNTYLEWARENLALNGYGGERHRFVREDCLKWLQDAIDEKRKYQLIFIDPPTFSNSKKMSTSLDITRDHVALLSGCLALLTEDGQIVFSTNARNFKLDESLREDCYLKEITGITTTEDFRRKPLHRCWLLAKQESALEMPQL